MSVRYVVSALLANRTQFNETRIALGTHNAFASAAASDSTLGAIVAFDRDSGFVRWVRERPEGGPRNLNAGDGRVVFVGSLAVAMDESTGAELWRFDPGASGTLGVSALAADAFVFGTDSVAWALDPATGDDLWSTVLVRGAPYSVLVRGVAIDGPDVVVVLTRHVTSGGSESVGETVMLNRTTGEVRWRYVNSAPSRPRIPSGEPLIAGQTIYVSDIAENSVVALERSTGALRWKWLGPQDGSAGPNEPPQLVGDTLWVSSADRSVYALDPASGVARSQRFFGTSVIGLALCGDRLLVNQLVLSVLRRSDLHLLSRDLLNASTASARFGISRFTTDGRRSWLATTETVTALECD